ncbi:hypothetical protein QUF80_01415 [Desulfococcaceae bacterium HSG8]|nr:hypothetical protein [Desulfococcaceae bacterium HSG8]
MNIHELTNPENPLPIADGLTFLKQQTGQDESEILARALHIGLNLLYRQVTEQLFIDGTLTRDKALEILGEARVADIEYAGRPPLPRDSDYDVHHV